jgi:hypothetical protein
VERTSVKAGGPSSPIDAEQWGKVCPWWLPEIDRPFDHWMVVAHFNWESSPLGSVRVDSRGLHAGCRENRGRKCGVSLGR